MLDTKRANQLRRTINENIRVQRGRKKSIPYIDVSNAVNDVASKHSHVIFGRRGCGKTLLLEECARSAPDDIRTVYVDCEDFKHHSFPNALIEVADILFAELERNLKGWFGGKKAARKQIQELRAKLAVLKIKADEFHQRVKEARSAQTQSADGAKIGLTGSVPGLLELNAGEVNASSSKEERSSSEREYELHDEKIRDLNLALPGMKQLIRAFFESSNRVNGVFLQIDDFYHLNRHDQPHIMDYIHRLCKGVPIFFKIATLRHASILFADRDGQPTGAAERHDYQPINVDYTLSNFRQTELQVRKIFQEFGTLASIGPAELDDVFKGDGFRRLVFAGGGVPRDCLSIFLDALQEANSSGDGRIGKDDIRSLSRVNFERRIEELKRDSERHEQDALIHGIYALRKFCLEKHSNVFFVSEKVIHERDDLRALIYRLLDYRIIHEVGTALTHKSKPGAYHAFAIDMGCYAHMRKLEGKFEEHDPADNDAKERMRSAPILEPESLLALWNASPSNVEAALREELHADEALNSSDADSSDNHADKSG